MTTMQKLLLVTLGLSLASTNAIAGAIVAAKNSPIPTLAPEEVRRIFLGHEAILAGLPVTLVWPKKNSTRSEFCSKVLDKTPVELNDYWARLVFTGKTSAPIQVGSDADVKAKVNATPGAIGYVSDASVDGSVKVLMRY